MASPKCFLCSGSVSSRSNPRHIGCIRALPKLAQRTAVLDVLQGLAKPTYTGAEDELEQRQGERWTHAFQQYLARIPPNALANLPFELQARIASFCRDSPLSRSMTLQYMCAFAKTIIKSPVPLPSFEHSIVITTGGIIRTQSLDFGDRSYVTSISTSSEFEGTSLELRQEPTWDYLVFVLDITGCRSVSLQSGRGACRSPDTWYRLIPRAWITSGPVTLTCQFIGPALRDATPNRSQAPLFDSLPAAIADLEWFSEAYPGRSTPCSMPRMMQRRVSNTSAITVVYLAGVAVDIHFHYPGADTESFYRALESFEDEPTLRYVELRQGEVICDVGVRFSHMWQGCSSTSLLVSIAGYKCMVQTLTSYSWPRRTTVFLIPLRL